MPQFAAPASLVPPGLHLDTFAESDSELLLDSPQKPVFQAADSDNDLNCSQKSSASTSSQCFNVGVIDYSKANQLSDLKQVQSLHSELDEGAMFSANEQIPRSATPLPGIQNDHDCNMENEVTPTKPTQDQVDPLTPTANLKMLISAASPEIRNREKILQQRRREDDEETADEFDVKEELIEQRAKKFRKRRTPKNDDITDEEDEVDNSPGMTEAPQPVIGRKEKSLGLLCQR